MGYLKLLLPVGLTFFLLQGCSFLYGEPEQQRPSPVIDVSQADEPWEVENFYAVNQDGEEWSTEQLKGQWWITKTIFTRCPTVCMTMTPNMVHLQDAIVANNLDIQIVSFTVDPEFDTPERLVNYGESYGADFNNWDFLTGYTQEEIEAFALETMKARVMKIEEQNDIAHPTRFFLVNGDGIIVRMYSGDTDFDLDATIKDLQSVVTN
ncbi:SCO family protein [Evansella tamaricis]|uniref:SCO family protein n=1 Tax=Evansella tamaricis TaxID=2069301 RepID=A0ABS6JE89_9BACI|nr:SCO family protein [Evansella tamaricis]MBU9711489.1 SCO family protein [Evansella tamaricis]